MSAAAAPAAPVPHSEPRGSKGCVRPFSIFALHAAVFALLAWASWRRWPDPLVDFGRELYVPWRILQGDVLYRDIASLFGPLSPYANALWMRLFGVSLLALAVVNMAILAAIVGGIHWLVRRATDRVTATAASLTTLALFGFPQYMNVGNYNFVTPYAHEATHGLALGLGVVAALFVAVETRRAAPAVAAGAGFGLLLLTKPEASLAAGAAAAVAWGGGAWLDEGDDPWLGRALVVFAIAAAVPPALFIVYFRQHLGDDGAIRAVATAWTTVWNADLTGNDFYIAGMGLDRPVSNILIATAMFGAIAAWVAAGAALSRTTAPGRAAHRTAGLERIVLVALVPAAHSLPLPRALPLVALVAAAAALRRLHASRADREAALRWLLAAMWAAFAVAFLAKMGLNARIHHYGFYLALPATTVAVGLLCWGIPEWLRTRWPGAAPGFRRLACWAVAAAVLPYAATSFAIQRAKTLPLGSGSDVFYATAGAADWRGEAVRDALAAIDRLTADGDRVAVLPEGVMLNYLSRRASPLRVVNFMPPEATAFGEDALLLGLEAAPPALVLIVQKDTREYGYPPFGSDPRYGRRTLEWVKSRYHLVGGAGRPSPRAPEFGIEIYRRN